MPEDTFVLVLGMVQFNLVVADVRKHGVKYAFGGPKREIMSPRGETKDVRKNY